MAEKEIGTVSNYFEHVGAAAIKLSAPVKVGDTLKFKGGEVEFEQKIEGMQIEREDVQKAKAGDEIAVIVSQRVRKGYRVSKVG